MSKQRGVLAAVALGLFTVLTCTQSTAPKPTKPPTEELVVAPPAASIPNNASGLYLPPPGQAPSFAYVSDIDIQGGAPAANLTQAAWFAWNEFVLATWPAQANANNSYNRDTPDPNGIYGQNATVASGPPLVWETFRHKVEIFPGTYTLNTGMGSGYNPAINQPPHGADQGAPDFGYNEPPEYDYTPGVVVGACSGTPSPTAPWVNADENSQIFLNYMFTGANGGGTAPQSTQQILFMAKANGVHYKYTVNPATVGASQLSQALWNHNTSDNPLYNQAVANFSTYAAAVNNGQPSQLQTPFISFPAGTVEVKSAWRPLTMNEMNSGRFHMATARNYQLNANGDICYSDDAYGLLALHIIQKTPTAPYFVYATFSQADNIQTPDGQPVEDENGNIIATNPGPTLDTGLTGAGQNPVAANLASPTALESYNVGTNQNTLPKAQCAPSSRLYFINIGSYQPNGIICVNQRTHPIPQEIISVNTAAHQAIQSYNAQYNNNGANPWLYYKLVNVQSAPIDKTPGVLYTGSNSATFYQSNEVVETNFNLQFFSGRLVADSPVYGILMSDYTDSGQPPSFNTSTGFKNTFFLQTANGSQVQTYNMGGCMGCHGNAQQAGDDFSFIMNVGRNDSPEARLTNAQIAQILAAQTGQMNPTAQASADKVKKFTLPH